MLTSAWFVCSLLWSTSRFHTFEETFYYGALSFFFKPVLSENVNAVNRNKYHLMLENRHVLFYVVYRCHLCVMRLFVSHFRAIYFAEAAGEQELVAWCVLEVI